MSNYREGYARTMKLAGLEKMANPFARQEPQGAGAKDYALMGGLTLGGGATGALGGGMVSGRRVMQNADPNNLRRFNEAMRSAPNHAARVDAQKLLPGLQKATNRGAARGGIAGGLLGAGAGLYAATQ